MHYTCIFCFVFALLTVMLKATISRLPQGSVLVMILRKCIVVIVRCVYMYIQVFIYCWT